MKRLQNVLPLKPEPHPENYTGYKFLSLVNFADISYICIVDNVLNNEIVSYVLDLFPKVYEQNIQELEVNFIDIASNWYQHSRHKYPLSIEISRRGMSGVYNRIIQRYPIDNVTRVIGPLPTYNMGPPVKIKKRKLKKLSSGITIVNNTNFPFI